jgi:HPt (histidine-containing phosphotransfer) domain-containing protein
MGMAATPLLRDNPVSASPSDPRARAPGNAAPPAVLDEVALSRLRALDPEGRHGVLARVLATYEASLVRQLEHLRAALPAPTPAVAILAHTLKSSSASVGAVALARACETLEARVRQGGTAQTHDVAELIALAEAALAAVRTMLRQ